MASVIEQFEKVPLKQRALVLAVLLRLATLILPAAIVLWMVWRGEIAVGALLRRLRKSKPTSAT